MKFFYVMLAVLLLVGCNAHKSNLRLGDLSEQKIDTVVEKLYLHRLTERIVQLRDYIDIVCNSKGDSETQSYYAFRAKELFAPNSKVLIRKHSAMELLPVDSFFNGLLNSKFDSIVVDSVDIPHWNNNKNLLNQSDSMLYMPCRQIHCTSFVVSDSIKDCVLPIVIDNTEDGRELMPYLGNLIVSAHETVGDTLQQDNHVEVSHRKFQFAVELNQLRNDLYQSRVKLVDEFFDRFNGKEGRMDIAQTDTNYYPKNLLLLFDRQMFQSSQDSTFKAALAMIEKIIDNRVQLNYSDSTWMAKAICQAHLHGKPISVTLYLNVERRKEDMYKWVIAKAEADFLKLKPIKSCDQIMLMPDDHETNFMSLRRATIEKDDYITLYGKRNRRIDETSVFFSYVYNGWLDIDYVSDLEFVFLQVPEYVFSIKQIERETYNSGWLITSFRKQTDAEKKQILETLYKY